MHHPGNKLRRQLRCAAGDAKEEAWEADAKALQRAVAQAESRMAVLTLLGRASTSPTPTASAGSGGAAQLLAECVKRELYDTALKVSRTFGMDSYRRNVAQTAPCPGLRRTTWRIWTWARCCAS